MGKGKKEKGMEEKRERKRKRHGKCKKQSV